MGYNNNNVGFGGQTPPLGNGFPVWGLCDRSGLGEKKTLNTSVVGKKMCIAGYEGNPPWISPG